MKTYAKLLGTLLLVFSLVASSTAVLAGTEEVGDAIDAGLEWLAEQQNPDGSWGSLEPWYPVHIAETGLAVLKFADHAVDAKYGFGLGSPFDEAYPYRENVERGLDYIFAHAQIIDIFPQPAGDPDTNGNDKGIYFLSPGGWYRTYETSIAMMAIAGSRAPARTVDVPISPVDGWTYKDVLQDAVDYLAFGQNDADLERGGWGYVDNYDGWSDQSNTGWATFALGYAESPQYKFACNIPAFVKTELDIWIDVIQDDSGGSWYTPEFMWINILKTGHLLYMMALVGDTAATPRVQAAVEYLVEWWGHPSDDPGWRGWAGGTASYQAAFNVMKGLTALGIKEIGGIDWMADLEEVIVAQQMADGSWPNTYWDWTEERVLSATWALLTLQQMIPIPRADVYVDIRPGSWPNPINIADRGVFAVAICGTEDFDVTAIDPGTVRTTMEGLEVSVSPVRWSYEDAATPWTGEPGGGHDLRGDGYLDLVVHFSTQEVVAVLGLAAYVGDTIPLILTANLGEEFGGKPIDGQDYVRVLAPRRR